MFGSVQSGAVEDRILRLRSISEYSTSLPSAGTTISSTDPMTIYNSFSTEIIDNQSPNTPTSYQGQNQSAVGLIDILQSIAMPIISNLLTTGKAFPRQQDYYSNAYNPQQYGYYNGYNNYYNPYNSYSQNYYPGISSSGVNMNAGGVGVRLLP